MPYLSTGTTPQVVGPTSGAGRHVTIASAGSPPFVMNWNATAMTDSSVVVCVDAAAIIAGTATNHGNIVVIDTGNGLGTRAGAYLRLWAECAHTSAPTIGGTLQVACLGRCPPRGPGQTSLLLAHEIYSASFPTIDPETGKWRVLPDTSGNHLITLPLPSTSAPVFADAATSKKMYAGASVRVPLDGSTAAMVAICGAMTLSAGFGVIYGQVFC